MLRFGQAAVPVPGREYCRSQDKPERDFPGYYRANLIVPAAYDFGSAASTPGMATKSRLTYPGGVRPAPPIIEVPAPQRKIARLARVHDERRGRRQPPAQSAAGAAAAVDLFEAWGVHCRAG
jgi:hypothetical protein